MSVEHAFNALWDFIGLKDELAFNRYSHLQNGHQIIIGLLIGVAAILLIGLVVTTVNQIKIKKMLRKLLEEKEKTEDIP